MHVGHQGHAVFVDEGQLGQLASLFKSSGLDVIGPDLYRHSQFVSAVGGNAVADYLFDSHRYSFLVTFGYHMQETNIE
jgi:hypothetical protein